MIFNKAKKSLLAVSLLALTAVSSAAVTNGQKFGDWQASCQTVENKNVCGIIQVVEDKDKKPVARIVLRKFPAQNNQEQLSMIITLPLGVNLQAGVALGVDGKAIENPVPYAFCDTGGCNTIIPLQGDLLNKLKAGKELQVAAFVANQQQTVPFSLKGVTSAVNAL